LFIPLCVHVSCPSDRHRVAGLARREIIRGVTVEREIVEEIEVEVLARERHQRIEPERATSEPPEEACPVHAALRVGEVVFATPAVRYGEGTGACLHEDERHSECQPLARERPRRGNDPEGCTQDEQESERPAPGGTKRRAAERRVGGTWNQDQQQRQNQYRGDL
jgi:hypothetical protein